MIELPRSRSSAQAPEPRIRILGLGGAGANALDRILLDGLDGAEFVALNTDAQALTSSVATTKVQLGRNTTRGLGAGGDPEVGYAAAEEAQEEIQCALGDAGMVFLLAGLGGGTGSGAAPLIASYARGMGAMVVAFVTLPFSFEGRRRCAQAEEAFASLQHYADVVICFENDRLGDLTSPRAGIHEAFSAADVILSQSVRAIASLIQRPGFVRVGFDELRSALRAQNPRCIFGFGEAEGDNRAHSALERALRSPLMDRGRLLEDAENVLVNIVGGPGMTLNEVQMLMEELNRHISDRTRLHFGTAVDARMGNRMSVLLLSALSGEVPAAAPMPAPTAAHAPIAERTAEPVAAPVIPEDAPVLNGTSEEHEAAPAPDLLPVPVEAEPPRIAAKAAPAARPMRTAPGTPVTAAAQAAQLAADQAKAAREMKQEQMSFEPVTRGRFEKSEPTIVDGQDLDVPAFMRRNLRVK